MRRGLNVIRSEKYFAHIIVIPNLTSEKKVGLIVKSRGELMHPNNDANCVLAETIQIFLFELLFKITKTISFTEKFCARQFGG